MSYQPSLTPYYGDLQTNTTYAIQIKLPWYKTIGHGTFSVLNANEIRFSGYYSVLGHSGSINLDLVVTGTNSGNAVMNGHNYPCNFSLDGDDLDIALNEGRGPTKLEVEWWHDGLWIGGPGTPHNIWIGPS